MRFPSSALGLPALAVTVTLLASGCSEDSGATSAPDIKAVATTTQMGDFVREVGGNRVEVKGILPPNADPHDYEPRPSDALAVGDAKVVFRSGSDLDAWLDGVLENADSDAPVVTGIDSVKTITGADDEHEGEEEHAGEEGNHDAEVDPHWWQDPRNAERAVGEIRDALVKVDPDRRAVYERNARRYLGELRRLDREVASCIAQIPEGKRKLVTTHDALGYYADRYGLDVIGAVIPSLSSQAQPSSKDTRELVDQIRGQGVEAIFPESSLNPKLEQAVSRETGAVVGEALWADTLGPDGSSGATYLESVRSNTESIVNGLTGGREHCGQAG